MGRERLPRAINLDKDIGESLAIKDPAVLGDGGEGGGGLAQAAAAARIEVEVDAVRQASRMYGHSLVDLLALANISVLNGQAGTRKFESAATVLRDHPEEVDLRIETKGPRTGMWSVVQPQWVTQVRRVH